MREFRCLRLLIAGLRDTADRLPIRDFPIENADQTCVLTHRNLVELLTRQLERWSFVASMIDQAVSEMKLGKALIMILSGT